MAHKTERIPHTVYLSPTQSADYIKLCKKEEVSQAKRSGELIVKLLKREARKAK